MRYLFSASILLAMVAVGTASAQTTQEWADIAHFQADNAALGMPGGKERRIVFMGDSITEGWSNAAPEFFEGRPYLERGISGQTTPQMLVRFREDVVDLEPAAVVILAGTNDIAENRGPATNEQIEGNLASMAEIADANGIEVVLSSILPVYDYPWRPGLEPAQRIVEINDWIENYCKEHGYVYLDYYTAMVDNRGGTEERYTYDGVHPNKAGYEIMGALAEEAIDEAVPQKGRRSNSSAYRRPGYFTTRRR